MKNKFAGFKSMLRYRQFYLFWDARTLDILFERQNSNCTFSDVKIRRLRGIITEFVEPGKGLIDFQKVYKQLMDHGFAGWVVLESFGRANQDDQEVVATLLDRFQYIK